MEVVLCTLDEIDDPGSREFAWGEGDWPLSFFVVRQGDAVVGYVNRCPHQGHPLNWQPDRFLTTDGELIICNSHGARFRIADGLCVLGPCPGQHLQPVKLRIDDGKVAADSEELQALLDNR